LRYVATKWKNGGKPKYNVFLAYFSFLRKEEKRKKIELTQSQCCVRFLAYARRFSTFSRLTNFPETLSERSAIVGDTNAVRCNFLQLVRNNNLPTM
jgi:hypothetical protein